MSMELSTSFIVMETKLCTKHLNLEVVHETRLHPNLLMDWHDALVGISPRMTQPIPTNHHLHRRSERPFFLSQVYSKFIPANNAGITLGELFDGVAKMLLFPVPGIRLLLQVKYNICKTFAKMF